MTALKGTLMMLLANHLSADHAARELRDDVRDGLTTNAEIVAAQMVL